MILIDFIMEAHPGGSPALTALLRATMLGSAVEDGCLIYRFTADLDSPTRFYLVELWENEAALTAHLQGEPFQHFLAELPKVGGVVTSIARNGELAPYTIKRPA